MSDPIAANARDLEAELEWLGRVLDARFKLYFGEPAEVQSVFDIPPPDLTGSDSPYAGFLRHYELAFAERLAVVLALVPHVRPQLLDVFFVRNQYRTLGPLARGPRQPVGQAGQFGQGDIGAAGLLGQLAQQRGIGARRLPFPPLMRWRRRCGCR